MLNKQDVKKIGVLRANALGDFILTIPAIEALKHAYPQAELILLGRKNHQEFLKNRETAIDRIIPIPECIQFNESMLEQNDEKSQFFKKMKEEDFDILIQLHGGGRYSNLFINRIGSRYSIGAKTLDAPPLDSTVQYSQFQHEILRQLEIVQLAGVEMENITPKIFASNEEVRDARTYLEKNVKLGAGPLILINPGAKDPRRRWPANNFISVADKLKAAGYTILFNIGPEEKELAKELKHQVNLISPGLEELTGIISLCELVISNDTGTLHLASALQKKAVGLFWFVNLLNYGPTTSKDKRILVSWEVQCPECKCNCLEMECGHNKSLIASIAPDNVLQASLELLNMIKEDLYDCHN